MAQSIINGYWVIVLGFAWARAVRTAVQSVTDEELRGQLLQSAQFYFDFMLPEAAYRLQLMPAACNALPTLR